MTTDALLIAAFIGLDVGAVLIALGWLSAKRQEMDHTDLRHQDRPRIYRR
jgi:hypothetical protein